jgi:hypothetical protein
MWLVVAAMEQAKAFFDAFISDGLSENSSSTREHQRQFM